VKKSSLVSKASDIVSYRPKPTISVDATDLPALKDWQVGKTYELTVKAKLVFMSEGDEYSEYEDEDRKRPTRARFRVVKVTEK
jgi:hypothetical protein